MSTKLRKINYNQIMSVIKSEYKDFNITFALGHYISSRVSLRKYDTTGDEVKRIKAAEELLELHRERRDMFAGCGVTDFTIDNIEVKKIFNN